MKISLSLFITQKTPLSRRKVLELIKAKKIWVNDKIATDMTMIIHPNKDRVRADKQVLEPGLPKLVYYKLNKPKGVITTLVDPRGRRTVAEFTARIPEKVVPIGRLDRDTTGLLLLTNDGHLANQIAHPSFHLPKMYQVILDQVITRANLARLLTGMVLEDGPFSFDKVEKVDEKTLRVTITEGRNRIIRRAFTQLGYEVQKLKRLSIGPVQLGKLEKGQLKRLTTAEVATLMATLKSIAKALRPS